MMNCAELQSIESKFKSESRRPEDCCVKGSWMGMGWNAGGQNAGNNIHMLSYTVVRWQKPNGEEVSGVELSFLLAVKQVH